MKSINNIHFLDAILDKDEHKRLQKTIFKKIIFIFMENLTTQRHSKKKSNTASKDSVKETVNSSASEKYYQINLQKRVITHL